MLKKRSYQDGCAIAHGLELVGERWALLIIRELIYGPKRFSDLRAQLRSISPNVLTQRLVELEQTNVLTRHRLPVPAAVWVYELTPWGQTLKPVIMALGAWASKSHSMSQHLPISAASLILALETTFQAQRTNTMKVIIGLIVDGQCFALAVEAGKLVVTSGAQTQADCTVTTSADVLSRLFYQAADWHDAQDRQEIQVTGNAELLPEFGQLFAIT